jgi:hypothetical protein
MLCLTLSRKMPDGFNNLSPWHSRVQHNLMIGMAQSFNESARPIGCFEIMLPAVRRRRLRLGSNGDCQSCSRRFECDHQFAMIFRCRPSMNHGSPQFD